MTYRFRQILSLAHEEATNLGHLKIEPEHLLLGLLHDPPEEINDIRSELHIDLEQARAIVNQLTPPANRIIPPNHQPGLSLTTSTLLTKAVEIAQQNKEEQAEPQHILLAILAEPDSRAFKVLEQLGGAWMTVSKKSAQNADNLT